MRFYLLFVVTVSIVAFILYAIDKSHARKGLWRIRESTLFGFGLFGGAIGALLGMQILRHKTRHWYFWAVNLIGLVLHIGVALVLLFVLDTPF